MKSIELGEKDNENENEDTLSSSRTIARHYKFSLSTAFALMPLAPAVLVVEDDLLFSPDFYEYFHSVGEVLEKDAATLFLVSAWSDNGFRGKVGDVYALRRTEYFPGLGWMLPRELYVTELEPQWPDNHWDHWLRASRTRKGREIVYPQVSSNNTLSLSNHLATSEFFISSFFHHLPTLLFPRLYSLIWKMLPEVFDYFCCVSVCDVDDDNVYGE